MKSAMLIDIKTASSVFEAGLDSFMKEVSSIDDIWKKVKTGCKLPFVLKILLHDKVTKRHGHLLIIDLLHPKFFTDITSKIHYSFISLRKWIEQSFDVKNKTGLIG